MSLKNLVRRIMMSEEVRELCESGDLCGLCMDANPSCKCRMAENLSTETVAGKKFDLRTLNVKYYDRPLKAVPLFHGGIVEIVGEQEALIEGKLMDQFLYNIVGNQAKNGQPFAALKSDLLVLF